MRRRTDAYLAQRVRQFERRCVIRILQRTEGNMTAAAKIAGRDRCSFYCLVKRHRVDWRSFRPKSSEPPPSVHKVADGLERREWFGVPLAAERSR